MVTRGLVQKEKCDSDRRGAFVVVTKKGGKAIEAAAPGHVRTVRHLFVDRLSCPGSWRSETPAHSTGTRVFVRRSLVPAVGDPLVRALMQAQAELLLEDADAIGTESSDLRTHDQRAADALVRVAQAMGRSAALSRGHPSDGPA